MREGVEMPALFPSPDCPENIFVPSTEGSDILSYSLSHVGKVRPDNQDAVMLCDPATGPASGYVYAIADGMGGFAHGGIASTLALQTFFDTYYAANGVSPLQRFRVAIQNANLSVYQTAHVLGAGRMGTTLTAVGVIGCSLYVGHIGDSRAYLVREGRTRCLTNDHTRVAELVRMKVLSPTKLRTHSQRSVLNRCLGLELFVQPDVFKIQVQEGDKVILCTDGVWSVIQDEEFGELANLSHDLEDLCHRVFLTAMDRDSDDNLSIVALHFRRLVAGKTTAAPGSDKSLSRFFRKLKR